MSSSVDDSSRRGFLSASTGLLGALTLGSTADAADESGTIELNAMSPTTKQIQAFLAMKHDGPVVMVNLLKFKPDGGAEEYAKYGAAVAPLLEKVGAKILFSGQANVCLIGNADWDAVALVEYPNKQALFKMAQSPEYQAIHHHREAGLSGQVNYAVIQGGALGAE